MTATLRKPAAKPPRKPCPCGKPAIRYKGSAPCCARCHAIEQRLEEENRRQGGLDCAAHPANRLHRKEVTA